MRSYILAIDQGTTGTTSIVFDRNGSVLAKEGREFPQYFPRSGWVEHDALEIWDSTVYTVEKALDAAGVRAVELAALGITNQRETSVFWRKGTCEPLGRAIVWQCRRSAPICRRLKEEGHEEEFHRRTGLVLDPYFSGTKITWRMENDDEFRRLAEAGEVCFGTVDSWLLARLTGGEVHATDFSNASRTLIYNIEELKWDEHLADILGVSMEMLPEVKPSSGVFGMTDPDSFLGVSVPVAGIAGDQQAALFGQACFDQGMTKNTYGTGSFVLVNTGARPVLSESGMLTTIAWGIDDSVTYALEGSIFITGAAIQWLRDGLHLIGDASETGPLAEKVEDTGGVYFVPAMVGLGAPYWDPYARGAILGITRGTTREQLARATVEAMAYQTRDVVDAMSGDSGIDISSLRVDGGASVMDLLLQFQSDILGIEVERPVVSETTAMGAAFLAGLAVEYWSGQAEVESIREVDRVFRPQMSDGRVEELYRGWKKAVSRSLAWEDG